MNEIKTFFVTLLSAVAAFLEPIANNVFAMLYFLAINFFIGMLCSIFVENEGFKWRKAGRCALEALIFFGLVVSFYAVGKFQGNENGAITAVSTIIYAGGWFYAIRILRNLKKMLKADTPLYNLVDFIYSIMSLEIAKRIPGMDNYINKHPELKK